MGTGQGWLKAGILGFPKSGKTYTGALLAVAAKRMFGAKEPIAMYDTEGGSEYIAPMIRLLTGQEGAVVRSRSFDDLMAFTKECEAAGIQVVLVDSITHPWRELCDSYLAKVNESRRARGWTARTKLEFQDWGPIKEAWSRWTDWYLNSKVHIIICGRAGFEYDMETNEETGRKELIKTGVKMKTESEFGFEPSLLIEMERDQHVNGGVTIVRKVTVLGDRFGLLDGKMTEFKGHSKDVKPGHKLTDKDLLAKYTPELDAVTKFFSAHMEALKPGAHAPIDTSLKTDLGIDENGDADAFRYRREKTIVLEEIKEEMLRAWPSTSTKEKTAKSDCLFELFGIRSWTAVESMSLEALRPALTKLKIKVAQLKGEDVPAELAAAEAPKTPEEVLATAAEDMPW
jgi:hypothetical protein